MLVAMILSINEPRCCYAHGGKSVMQTTLENSKNKILRRFTRKMLGGVKLFNFLLLVSSVA